MGQQITNDNFSIVEAIHSMINMNKSLSHFVSLKKYNLATEIATMSWNLALIANLPIGNKLKIKLARRISSRLKINSKQATGLVNGLIQLKYTLYPKIHQPIFHYDIIFGTDNNPTLQILASKEFSAELIVEKINSDLA